MTTLNRPELKQPMQRMELPVRREPPETPVRWIAWTVSIVILGIGALVALFMLRGETENFEEIYEAQSPLSYGAVNEPGFTVAPRWTGESDLTLEEVEMFAAYEASTGEADLVLRNQVPISGPMAFTPQGLAMLQASVGSADRIYLGNAFTASDLAALQASVGSADQKYLEMTSTG